MMLPAFDSTPGGLALWMIAGYLMGSIPFGLLLSRIMGLGDLRSIGSGNIGATNVLRTGNRVAAALTLVLDGAKGAVAVLLAAQWSGEAAAQVAALAAMLGHCYPVWLRFQGGKGVATFLGLWLALAWPVGAACCATWILTAATTRISSMGALAAVASALIWAPVLGYPQTLSLGAVMAALVFWRHRGNIARLRDGTEPRIGGS